MRFGWIGLLLVATLPAAVWAEDLDERIPVELGGLLEIDMDYGEGLRPDPGFLEIASHAAREVRIVADASGWGTAGVRRRSGARREFLSSRSRICRGTGHFIARPSVERRPDDLR